ncbi:11596_t:CDS:2 [Gigaspora margarita]|uniref:11596_t:CDS:1 n=1 Tax=Gigaspora margarita TaxID=4874 RepID=A0ABN7VES7_GIGMA|nr:11596_t:CDS:2 [Gigaspora margarita]
MSDFVMGMNWYWNKLGIGTIRDLCVLEPVWSWFYEKRLGASKGYLACLTR